MTVLKKTDCKLFSINRISRIACGGMIKRKDGVFYPVAAGDPAYLVKIQ
jgi:hypothetical protein